MGYNYDCNFFQDFFSTISNNEVCQGVRNHPFTCLYSHGLSGTAPVELLKNVERLRAAGFHSLADAIREEGIIGEYNIPLFYGAGNCIRSVFCHWKSSTEAGPCCECLSIANNRALQQLAIRTGERYLQYHNKVGYIFSFYIASI
jgi:hypothetical protein